jgi:hypothetical protein
VNGIFGLVWIVASFSGFAGFLLHPAGIDAEGNARMSGVN